MSSGLVFQDCSFEVPARGLAQVSGSVAATERVAVMGPSGCGKSTFLRTVSGLHPLHAGKILLNGEDFSSREPEDRGVSLVFQNGALFSHMSILENIRFPLRFAPASREWSSELQRSKALEWLAKAGLEALADRSPLNLSGGERQRVALLRALIVPPKLLLLDEPLSSVDETTRLSLGTWMIDRLAECQVPTLFVTHDQGEAQRFGNRVVRWNEENKCLAF